jgi:hypothetical protein
MTPQEIGRATIFEAIVLSAAGSPESRPTRRKIP